MAGMTRGAGGGTTVIAQPQTEILPGLDRPAAVLWLGISLVVVNEKGLIENAVRAAKGDTGGAAGGSLKNTGLELGLVGLFWIMARVSDSAGSLAILLLIGLWLVWLTTHVGEVAKFFGRSIPSSGPAKVPPVKPVGK